MKGCIFPFPKKGDLGLAKNYQGTTLTSITAEIYNALLNKRIEPKIDNILRKNQNGFQRNRSMNSQILTVEFLKVYAQKTNRQKYYLLTLLRGKMEQILLAYGLPKKTVAAIMMLYRNTKVKVHFPDGDIDYFNIVVGVQQGDTLVPLWN